MSQQKDVVCGMMVEESSTTATSDHKGKRYYFCSKDCKMKFDANPGQYSRKA